MKNYIGVKLIGAQPMNLGEYNKYRGWQILDDEDPEKEGYLVKYPDGYESWSPKDVFEEAYRETSEGCMTFGLAVEAAKKGLKIARTGWNGVGMYAVLMPGYPDGIVVNEATRKAHGLVVGASLTFRPYFQLFTAQGDVASWAPSGSDSLAEDWVIVTEGEDKAGSGE